MTQNYDDSEWAPITDEDLFRELPEDVAQETEPTLAPRPLEEFPSTSPLPQTSPLPSTSRLAPSSVLRHNYTAYDWKIFDLHLREYGVSIDTAAHSAGIDVYDALTSLEKRDPYFYEFKVMIHPQGYGNEGLRRRGVDSIGISGQTKNYVRSESQVRVNGDEDGRPSEEEVCRRFLEMIGNRNIHERVDGQAEPVRAFRRGIFVPGEDSIDPESGEVRHRKRLRPRKIQLVARKCRNCGGKGHDTRNCPVDKSGEKAPAGSLNQDDEG